MLTGFLSCVGLWKIFTFNAIMFQAIYICVYIYLYRYAITFVIRKNKCCYSLVP